MRRARWTRRNACGGTMKLPWGARAIAAISASISLSLRTSACCGSMPKSRAAPSIERHHCGVVGFARDFGIEPQQALDKFSAGREFEQHETGDIAPGMGEA